MTALIDDLNDPVVSAIIGARVWLLMHRPFYGQLATRLIVVDASKWCDTAATDGRHLFYNREFIKKLSKENLIFLIAHEIYHVIFDHIGRRGWRDPKIHNAAIDLLTNYSLVEDKVGKMPEGGLYDPKYTDEMSSEEIYDLLIKNSVTIKAPLDMHLEIAQPGDDGEGSSGPNNVEVTVLGQDGPPVLTKEDIEQIQQETRAAIIQAAQSVGADKVPKSIRRMISDLITPKMDWRALLDAHIRSSVRDDYSFQRPSRRSGHGFIFPGQDFMDTIDIVVAIDASGSLSDDMLRDFLSEVKGIMETFGDFKLQLFAFDTKVENYVVFTSENIDDIHSYDPGCGGGTLFEVVFNFVKDNGIEAQRLVMFTDGLPNSTWGDEGVIDTLFVIYGNKNIVAPWGVTAHYDCK